MMERGILADTDLDSHACNMHLFVEVHGYWVRVYKLQVHHLHNQTTRIIILPAEILA